MMGVSAQDIVNHVVTDFIPVIVSLSFHEWGHAAAAIALGDETPREQGRLTLNPVAHLSWFGSVLLPLSLIVLGLPPFGWARPVEFSPRRFTRNVRLRTAIMLTAAAGPAVNLLLAILAAAAWAAFSLFVQPDSVGPTLLQHLLIVNVILFLFNLLPVPPLDGSRVLRGLLPVKWRRWMPAFERVSPLVLGLLFMTGVGAKLITRPTVAISDRLQQAAVALLH
jgi:Zn-dependent protease